MSQRLLKYFLKLGATGFGGPLVLIQQMRSDLVVSQHLIDEVEFDQAFALIKAMPGPIAFQMAVFCGQKLCGLLGAFMAGLGLIAPAFLMMLAVGHYYLQLIVHPEIQIFFTGMQYAVAAVILFGLKNFMVNYKNNILFWLVIIAAATLFYLRYVPESLIITGFGFFVVGLDYVKNNKPSMMAVSAGPFLDAVDLEKLGTIFTTCFTAGALVFGTGLAIFPFLQTQFVDQLSWLSVSVFNDGVTFGQMTPGPVTISVTFLGYQIAGLPGAVVATMGLLIPPFFHMTTWFPKAMSWMKMQTWISRFLMGSTAAVVGCLLVTVYRMNSNEINNFHFWIVFGLSALALYLWPKISVLKLLLAAGVVNLVFSFMT